MSHMHVCMVVVTAASLVSCATLQPVPSPEPATADVITAKELSTIVGTTPYAYAAVERLRPSFFVSRPGSGSLRSAAPQIYVFINGNLVGDVEALRTIPLANVVSIRRAQAVTAYTKLGEVYAGDGVIEVRLR